MGVGTENNVTSHLSRNLPELRVWVISAVIETEEVDLERDVKSFSALAQFTHVSVINIGRTDEIEQVGMGKISETSGLHGLFCLLDIAGELFLTSRRHAAVRIAALISEEVLAEQQVFDRVIIEQTKQVVKIGGVIFGLKAYVDLGNPDVYRSGKG